MKTTISILFVVLWTCTSNAQIGGHINKRYYDIEDEDRITTFSQEDIKKNRIDLSLYQKKDTLSKQPEFIDEKDFKQLKFPMDTSRNFEVEIELTLDGKKELLELYFADRPMKVDTNHVPKDDILVQFDMWHDGIYNVLQRLHSTELIGVSDLKKIRADHEPDKRKMTVRKINGEFEFYVNTNLILVILPPDPVNEIGFKISKKALTLDKVTINYLVDFEDD